MDSRFLEVRYGQCSSRGRKPLNQDHHGCCLPARAVRQHKGIALALADGISSSEVSHEASAAAVRGFLGDYYATPASWSVRHAAQRVLGSLNAWLYAHSRLQAGDDDRGHVCTFSALIVKSATAHLFHVGDARIWRLAGDSLQQLTDDHRLYVSRQRSYLARALGTAAHVEIDYHTVGLAEGDLWLLTTDGVHDHLSPTQIRQIVEAHHEDLDAAAQALVAAALQQGSDDNLTVQLLRIEHLPGRDAGELASWLEDLPPLELLEEGRQIDGLRVLRRLHSSARSHVYRVEPVDGGPSMVLKAPTAELLQDRVARQRFLRETWVAQQLDNPHLLRACCPERPRSHLYSLSEFIDGQTLRQWMHAHPQPPLETVTALVAQIIRGLQALHRLDMLHRDLRPENILLDRQGQVRIIDYGATQVASLHDDPHATAVEPAPGSLAYSAPESWSGEPGSAQADQFSLAVIAYEMLCGQLPYGTEVLAHAHRQLRPLRYRPLGNRPAWLDQVLYRALQPTPERRFEALSAFLYHLRHPDQPLDTPPPVRSPRQRLRRLQWLCAGQGLALLLLLIWVIHLHALLPRT